MTQEAKKIVKRYNGSAQQIKPRKTSNLSIKKICNTVKLARGLTIDRLMNEVR